MSNVKVNTEKPKRYKYTSPIALDIFRICVENYIKILLTWIPREQKFSW